MKYLRGLLIFVASTVALYLATQFLALFIGGPIHAITSQSKSALQNIEPLALVSRYLGIYNELGSCSPIRSEDHIRYCLQLSEAVRKLHQSHESQAESEARCQDEAKLGPTCTRLRQSYEYFRDLSGSGGIGSYLFDIPYTFGRFVYDLLSQPLLTAAVQAVQLIVGFVLASALTYSLFVEYKGSLLVIVALWIVLGLAGTAVAALLAMAILWIVAALGWFLALTIPERPEIFVDPDGHLTFSVWGASLVTIGQTSAARAVEGGLHHRLARIFERFFGWMFGR
jgi:hypothetical protein